MPYEPFLLGVGVVFNLSTENQENGRAGIRCRVQTLAVDTRTAVWVSTAEKIILRDARTYSRKFGAI